MLVYRVEDENGEGPYVTHRDTLWDMYQDHNKYHDDPNDDLQPSPGDDGLERLSPQEYSGFASPEAAQTWFEGYGEVLHESGYSMTAWYAPDVRKGKRQVAFRKDSAHMVDSYPVMEYIR